MIGRTDLEQYRGRVLWRGPGYLYLPPHGQLLPSVANYTLTCPTPDTMPEAYTVLPTASSTLIVSAGEAGIVGGLRGVNTRACEVGGYARSCRILLLIEFRPAGLYPFFSMGQDELADRSFPFDQLDGPLNRRLIQALERAGTVEELVGLVDRILLSRLTGQVTPAVAEAMHLIQHRGGGVSSRELCGRVFYSEKQLGRLFRRQLGTGIKTFSRIVRVNGALRRLERPDASLEQIAGETGYYDPAHLVRDIQALCGIAPTTYRDRTAQYYRDGTKL